VPRAIAMGQDAVEAKDLTSLWISPGRGDGAWTGGHRTWSGDKLGTRSLLALPAPASSALTWLPPARACSVSIKHVVRCRHGFARIARIRIV
jgi:hypothetical protein